MKSQDMNISRQNSKTQKYNTAQQRKTNYARPYIKMIYKNMENDQQQLTFLTKEFKTSIHSINLVHLRVEKMQ